MSAQTVYSGPGKVRSTIATNPYNFHAEGENGKVDLKILEKRDQRSTGTFGYIRSTLADQMAELTLTPFDSWALLPALFPTYLGVTTGSNTGALVIGTRPHDYAAGSVSGKAVTTVWTPDGRLYTLARSAIVQHPGMKLGVGQPLFDAMKIAGLWDAADAPGGTAANFLTNTESGSSDPDTVGFTPDFVNGHWTGAWAALTGFTAMEVEDFWQLQVQAKYSTLTIQKLSRHLKLDSVEFMIKGRLAGPTHTQILAKILAHTLGGALGEGTAADLILTGPGSKTVTLKDCEIFLDNSGFEFGGTKLGTGEVAFVSRIDFSGSPDAPQPALIFSA
ncbi:MAG TPA: hypothetical protein VK742_20460 [Candidatus Sulfotelmatobacter sp.]|jgi:hypothetical protein|nr:hypothetical protein [Candidatus Sulfotelmatobacter sp.]